MGRIGTNAGGPRAGHVEPYGVRAALVNESLNCCIKVSYCSLKLGPVEAGKVNTSGTGGGGGHETATGTGVAHALNISAKAGNSCLIFMVGTLLFPVVFGRGGFRQFLGGRPFGLSCGNKSVVLGLHGVEA